VKYMKINCAVYVSTENDDKDPEEVASDFNLGLGPAVEDFPTALVGKAEVVSIEEVSEETAAELGLVEDE